MAVPTTVAVLQHVACEPPGTYTPHLAKRGALVTYQLDQDGASGLAGLHPEDLVAVVAMGGPMGVYETDRHPWLVDELSFIARTVDAGVPFLGVCLGAQLLAGALGADVFPGPVPEVGVDRVTVAPGAAADPVFAGLPPSFEVLQWHGDTFDLPEGATLLAGSARYPHQAFAVGSAYGLQFHAEASWALAGEWLGLDAYRRSLEAVLGPEGPATVAADLQAADQAMEALAVQLVEAWLTTFVDPRLA
jgi:GMP synthase-like glutamine amidotransferase